VNWIYMALSKDKFLAVVKTVMILRVILKKTETHDLRYMVLDRLK